VHLYRTAGLTGHQYLWRHDLTWHLKLKINWHKANRKIEPKSDYLPKNAKRVVKFLMEGWPSSPFISVWLSNRGLGLSSPANI
jgi:hypothetical protein